MRGFRVISSALLFGILALFTASCAGSSSVSQSPAPAVSPTVSPTASPAVSPTASPSSSSPPSSSSNTPLWQNLRQGKGYVILFRHALAPGTGDPANFRLDDCATQRNLSAEGRAQAVRMGEVLRQQQIPVARVLSSQWCRCLETARLMDLGQVEPFPALNSFFQDRSREDSQTEQLRQFILENRENPGVTVMVTHQVNITAISEIVPESGAAVVVRAESPEQVEVVGQLDPL